MISFNCLAQTWEKINMSFTGNDSILYYARINFVTKNIGWISTTGYNNVGNARSILLETKDGENWKLKEEYFQKTYFTATCNLDSNNIWFLGGAGSLLYTNNMGLTWDTASITIPDPYVPLGGSFGDLHFFDSKNGIALNNCLWLTNDGGYTWERWTDTSTVLYLPRDVCFINERLGWVVNMGSDVTDVGSIANTMDGGKNWQYQHKRAPSLYDVIFLDSLNGFAVGSKVLFNIATLCVSKDGGANWNIIEFGSGSLNCIEFLDSINGWIGGAGKIYRTTNGGDDWELQVDNKETSFEQLIILKKEKIAYAFGKNWNDKTHTLLRADLSNLTGINERNKKKREDYFLSENYPNPFNPSTVITYSIPEYTNVKIKIYNLLGEEIIILVNKEQVAGKYQVHFNGNYLPSGIYFYQLITDKFLQTKKMLLLQ